MQIEQLKKKGQEFDKKLNLFLEMQRNEIKDLSSRIEQLAIDLNKLANKNWSFEINELRTNLELAIRLVEDEFIKK